MNKAKYIGESINQLCGVDIYENKRTQDLVDIRSMACFILHKDLKMTLYEVRDHFNFFGKQMNHTSVLHNVRLFAEVRKRKTHLEAIRDTIMQTVDPKYSLLKRIEEINDKGKIEQITNCVNYNE
jgi:hypothetical protein